MPCRADRGSSAMCQLVIGSNVMSSADSAEDVIVVREVGLAVLAAVDAR